jgi:HEAT repeat protein
MLFLLRECHGRSYASEVREFLGHEVPLVRLEAARTLLSFQAPGAEQAVVKLLSADNFQLQKGAVQLAGTYRIREALPYLVRLLREKDILGKKFLIKRSIIRSLGRIGHESVLNPLLHICRETSLIHKENYDKLKVDIYRTLHHYPVTAVKPFIDYGMKTNNKEITVLSRKLAERYLRAVERQQK